METAQDSKRVWRERVRQTLKALDAPTREMLSAQARERLLAQPRWHGAESILFFAPLPGELDIWPLATEAARAGKLVGLPRFSTERGCYIACQVQDLGADLVAGRFGIREPAEYCARFSLNRLDLLLVPALAFDLHGRRLGRGRGFFDRLLAEVRGTTCGVGFDEQIVPALPAAPHDVSVNCILTPTRWIEL